MCFIAIVALEQKYYFGGACEAENVLWEMDEVQTKSLVPFKEQDFQTTAPVRHCCATNVESTKIKLSVAINIKRMCFDNEN